VAPVTAGALRLAGLGPGCRAAGTLAWAMAGVPSRRADLVVRLAPVAQIGFGIGPVALECGAELDRRHLRLRVPRIRLTGALRDGQAGE